jgi:hypothetical protein
VHAAAITMMHAEKTTRPSSPRMVSTTNLE